MKKLKQESSKSVPTILRNKYLKNNTNVGMIRRSVRMIVLKSIEENYSHRNSMPRWELMYDKRYKCSI